jgi:hypothetical protein
VTDIESRASDLKAQAEIMQVMLASLMESLDEVIYPVIRADRVTEGMEIYCRGEWVEVVEAYGDRVLVTPEASHCFGPDAEVIARRAR